MKYRSHRFDIKWLTGLFLSVILAFVTVLLTTKKKKIAITDASDIQITSLAEIDNIEVDLHYKGEKISDLWLFKAKVLNEGNVAISKNDFEENLEFVVDSNATIIDVKTTGRNPEFLPSKIEFEQNRFYINPTLLNPGEYIEFEILFSSSNFISVGVRPRIKGVNDILFRKKDDLDLRYHLIDWPFGFISTCIAIFFLYLGLTPTREFTLNFWGLILLALILWGVGISLMDNGARFYNFYPPLWVNVLIFLPIYLSILVLLIRIFKKRSN